VKTALNFVVVAVTLLAAGSRTVTADQLLPAGEAVFIKQCAKCHQVGPNAKNRVGPALNSIIGKQAGTVQGFKNYSDALRRSGIIWTPENFRNFIKDPKGMVAGTNQVYKGMQDDESITLLIEYLKTK
jgi:cytochrome c